MPGINPSELERIDQALKTQLDILRHSATVESEVLRILEAMRKDLISKLAQADLTNWSKQRLNTLLRDSEALIASYYAKAQDILSPTYQTVAGISAAQTATAMAVTAPSRAVLESLVGNMLVEGAPMKAWWVKQSTDTAFKFASAVRQGIAQSETLNQIFKRVNEATDLANRNSIALVHTSVMQVMNDASREVIEQNADVAPAMRWLSALDSHVCWSAETLILMADGTQKPAGGIRIGDMVIGGVTGKPCRVVNTGSRIVASSVVIHYNGKIIGRVTHDHPVLTKSGWKEIGSVSLSADISERQVLCRGFRAPEETVSGTPEICGERRGIRTAQCDTEAREAHNDNTCIEPNPTGSVFDGNDANQGAQYESSERLQYDERWGRCGGYCTGNIKSDGQSAVKEVQRGCRIQKKNACNPNSYWCATLDKIVRILGIARRSSDDKTPLKFSIMEGKECHQQQTSAYTSGKAAPDKCGQEGLARPSIPCEGERSTGGEASGATHDESGMGRSKSSEDVSRHERKMERTSISGEDGEKNNYTAHYRTTEGGCSEACMDTRKTCGSGGENPPTVGEKEDVTFGVISGIELHSPVEVFNITVESDHSYVAGGIIVHNCMICAPRDGLEWSTRTKRPIGHDLPYMDAPAHIGCRCKIIPVTEFSKDVMEAGERASTFGPVKGETTFEQFLKRQSKEFQEDVLGKGRAELYRKGKLTLRDLVSGRGAPLTLKQLERKYP